MDTHPSVLHFVTSSEVVAAATPTFGYVPSLPGTIPEGVRLMESSTEFDPQPDGPWRESQLYHADYQWQSPFTSPVRNDFIELWRPQRVFPVRDTDSALRRLVLDIHLVELD